jgi:mono/diheme cytochrome c family protein
MKTLRAASRLLLCAAALALAACSPREPESAEPGPPKTPPSAEQLARGSYLAALGGCYACHTVRGGAAYAGGLEMQTPFGTFVTSNITPDPEHGIGRWSADDFWRAMHEGRGRDGAYLYPAFPYTNYTRVTREDSDAIHAYLMSVAPVAQPEREHALRFPYNLRPLLAAWRALYFEPGVHRNDPARPAEWNRGAYLVQGLGHCNACHATRNVLGAVSTEAGHAGGLIPLQNWYAPSLSSSREAGLGDWALQDIVELLGSGISTRGAATGPMAAVVQHSLQKLTREDLTAMAAYLQAQGDGPSAETVAAPAAAPKSELGPMLQSGERIYRDRCAACHGDQGEGVPRIYPPLAGNQAVRLHNPINAIRIVLNGGFPPSTAGNPRPYGMPPFYQELNDEEVAAVLSYIRQAWGNAAAPVWSVDVQKSRGVPAD